MQNGEHVNFITLWKLEQPQSSLIVLLNYYCDIVLPFVPFGQCLDEENFLLFNISPYSLLFIMTITLCCECLLYLFLSVITHCALWLFWSFPFQYCMLFLTVVCLFNNKVSWTYWYWNCHLNAKLLYDFLYWYKVTIVSHTSYMRWHAHRPVLIKRRKCIITWPL